MFFVFFCVFLCFCVLLCFIVFILFHAFHAFSCFSCFFILFHVFHVFFMLFVLFVVERCSLSFLGFSYPSFISVGLAHNHQPKKGKDLERLNAELQDEYNKLKAVHPDQIEEMTQAEYFLWKVNI